MQFVPVHFLSFLYLSYTCLLIISAKIQQLKNRLLVTESKVDCDSLKLRIKLETACLHEYEKHLPRNLA